MGLKEGSDARWRVAVALLAAAYVAIMARAQFNKLDSFEMGFDLALYEQVIWNTAHGRAFATSVPQYTDRHLGADVILIEALLAIPHRLVPDTRTLLLLQTVVLAAGVVPLYALARYRLGPLAGTAFAFAWLAYKPLHFLNLYEFQPRAFALGPLLGMFYFLDRQHLRGFVVCAVLALCTRSDIALVVAMFGVYALVTRKPRAFGIWALVLGVGWFATAIFVVVPHFNRAGHFQYFSWYGNLGSDPGEALATVVGNPALLLGTLFTGPKLLLIASIYGLLAFLPLLRPGVLLIALPPLAMNLLSPQPMMSSIRRQYPAALYPLAFVGAVLAVDMLLRLPALARRRRWVEPVLLGLVVAVNVGAQWLSPPTTWRFFAQTARPAFAPALDRLIDRIPKDAAVAASNHIAPHLARRERLYLFPPGGQGFYSDQGLARADYVLFETPRPGEEDPWTPILERDPWVLVGVGYYEPREYRYLYRLYRRRLPRKGPPPGDSVPVARTGLPAPDTVAYTPAMEIQGASALVTGAGRGIGRAVAIALARGGAHVTAVSRTAVELDSLVEQIEAGGGKAHAHPGDVCDPQICEGAVRAAGSHGRLQILVNNAGVAGFAPMAETTDEDWDRILGTNLTAAFRLTRAALPQLCKGGGHVFMISSLAGSNAIANMAAYCASKAALDHLARCLMLEVRHQGVKVTTIAPGTVDTGFGGMPREGTGDWALRPEDVAGAVVDVLRTRDEAHLSRVEMRPLRPTKRA